MGYGCLVKTRYKILIIIGLVIFIILFLMPILITSGTHLYCDIIDSIDCERWYVGIFGIDLIQILYCEIEGRVWVSALSGCYDEVG